MGLRLILHPALNEGALIEGMDCYPANLLEMRRDFRVFDQLSNFGSSRAIEPEFRWTGEKIPTYPLPPGIRIALATEEGYNYCSADPLYREPLCYAFATDLARLEIPEDSEDPNKAILSFLQQIPGSTKVVLIWMP